MHTYRTRALSIVVAAPALVAVLAACGSSGPITATGTAGPAGVSTSTPATSLSVAPVSSTSSSSGHSSGSSSGSTSGSGCPAGGVSIPAGAGRATTADLDNDGRKDTLWLADIGSKRTLGVRTASGHGSSITFSSAAPEAAVAVAGLVQKGIPIILLDTGRSASVYTFVDCSIVATKNPQGAQYVFDHGFTGYGTGAGCPVIGSETRLVGYLATSTSGSKFTVTRTEVAVTDQGRKATNGTTTTLGTGLSSSSPTVKTAESFTCGSGGTAAEPQ